MKKEFETTMKVVCAWHKKNFGFELDMGTKEGHGSTGTTHGICPECAKIEWAKVPKTPARWNRVGRFLARRRAKKQADQIAEDQEEDDALLYLFRNSPNLHAQCMLRGERGRHYILVEDLAILQARVSPDPEISCHLN